jgi:phytoene synthase
MEALYAFLRFTDDLADCPQPARVRQQSIIAWRDALHNALQEGAPTSWGIEPQHARLRGPDISAGLSLLPAVVDAVRRYAIPPEHLFAVVDGVEMDAGEVRFETFDDLAEYCHKVASAVGLACIHIWGFRGPVPIQEARQCGLALQLTNIVRDVGEDVATGRVYLPQADLRACGCEERDLRREQVSEPVARVMRLEIERAEALYREGAALFDRLEPGGRRVFGVMLTTYHRLLREVERNLGEVLRRRIRLSRRQKAAIVLPWLCLPPRRSRLP